MFELETSLIFWSAISFAILLVLLYKVALPPLLILMEKRRTQIQKDLSAAESSKIEAAKLASQSQSELQATLTKSEKILYDSKLNAQVEKHSIIARAQNTASKLFSQAQIKIVGEEEKAKQELRELVSTLVTDASNKVIGKVLSEKEHLKIIENSLREL